MPAMDAILITMFLVTVSLNCSQPQKNQLIFSNESISHNPCIRYTNLTSGLISISTNNKKATIEQQVAMTCMM